MTSHLKPLFVAALDALQREGDDMNFDYWLETLVANSDVATSPQTTVWKEQELTADNLLKITRDVAHLP
jgi:hypothetical protein